MFLKLFLLLILTIISYFNYAGCVGSQDPNGNAELTNFMMPNMSWICSGKLCPVNKKKSKEPTIDYFTIKSYIKYRYSTTYVMSQITNQHTKNQTAEFSIFIPSTAHISRLTIEIDKELHDSKLEKRKNHLKAERIRTEDEGGPLRKLQIKTKLKPKSKVTYHLVYEELLVRKNGQYSIDLNVHLGQIIKNLDVQVLIKDNQPVRFVKVPLLIKPGDLEEENSAALNPKAEIKYKSKSSVLVRFKPTPEQQMKFINALKDNVKKGLDVQFRVHYDVERHTPGGEMITYGPNFVHFFAPEQLKPLPKYVIFVLDTSGSMDKFRMQQLRLSMAKILPQLKSDDLFSIIKFNSHIEVVDIAYKKGPIKIIRRSEILDYGKIDRLLKDKTVPNAVYATKENIDEAIKQINQFKGKGVTNIITSTQLAIHMARKIQSIKTRYEPMIMLITDGQPSFKTQTTEQALKYITEYNKNIAAIFSVGISPDVHFPFLRQLSALNRGTALYIKNMKQVPVLLERFFDAYSTPVLNNIHFLYGTKPSNLTQVHFTTFYEGTELVVAGKLDNVNFIPKVIANARRGKTQYLPHISQSKTPLDRIWAYLKAHQNIDELTNKQVSDELISDTLNLALKYSFVTPLSSLAINSSSFGIINDDVLLEPAYEPIKNLSSIKIKQTKNHRFVLPFELSKHK